MADQTTPTGSDVGATPSSPPKQATPPKTAPKAIGSYKDFVEGLGKLEPAQEALLQYLWDINGQDAYDAEAAAVGRLKQEEYLALPKTMVVPDIHPTAVGRSDTRAKFKVKDLAAIYFMNKARAPAGENAAMYAMIRLEAVKMGWVAKQREIMYLDFDKHTEALQTLLQDLANPDIKNRLADIRTAAFLIPLVAEHTFRTYGHHYISGQATEYQARYRDTLRSCLQEHLSTLLQAPTLYHHVLHWVSPGRSYNVIAAQMETRTLPDAIVIRANASPAGTAIITTTDAVLNALKSADLFDEIVESCNFELEEISKMTTVIRQDVRKWHKAYYAYGVAGPTQKELARLEAVKQIAINFAPYSQGFIEATLANAALGKARALKKHADLNPIAQSKAKNFFRKLARREVAEIADLFKSEVVKKKESGVLAMDTDEED